MLSVKHFSFGGQICRLHSLHVHTYSSIVGRLYCTSLYLKRGSYSELHTHTENRYKVVFFLSFSIFKVTLSFPINTFYKTNILMNKHTYIMINASNKGVWVQFLKEKQDNLGLPSSNLPSSTKLV